MYANFIYFILILLIYLTYQPSEIPAFSGLESLLAAGGALPGICGLTRAMFRRIENRIGRLSSERLDQMFHTTQFRSSGSGRGALCPEHLWAEPSLPREPPAADRPLADPSGAAFSIAFCRLPQRGLGLRL